jgi:hypothetical protein
MSDLKPDRTSKGRLVILAIRLSTTNKRSFRTKNVRRIVLDHPVYAITKLDEKYTIFRPSLTVDVWCIHGEIH